MKETAQIPVPTKDPAAAKDDKTPDAAKATNPAEDAPVEEELVRIDKKRSFLSSFLSSFL